MIKPNSEDVKVFNDYSIDNFQYWLRTGLECYLLEDDVWAFEPVALFINQDDHLVLDLNNIYDVLPYKLKAYFRQAVAYILATLATDEKEVIVFEHLLLLASKISATEILSVLPSRIGNGFFGKKLNSDGQSLFGVTIRTIAELAAPIEDSVHCLQALITSRFFEDAYAGMALIALCRVKPEDLATHLESPLKIKLHKMFQEYQLTDTEKRRWAKQILNTIGFYNLKEALLKLKIIDMEYEVVPSHKWLSEALFKEGEEKPLISYKIVSIHELEIYETDKPSNSYIICSTTNPALKSIPETRRKQRIQLLQSASPSSSPIIEQIEVNWQSVFELPYLSKISQHIYTKKVNI